MKNLLIFLFMFSLCVTKIFSQEPNGSPNPHGLALQYCYGGIKKVYNTSAGPHYLNVVKGMEHLVYWNHSLGVWAYNNVDVRIFEETSPGNWTLVLSQFNVPYLPMSGYTFPVKFTFNSSNLFKVEFYGPGLLTPLDINSGSQVYIKPYDMEIIAIQPYNTCPLPKYTTGHAINYSLWPLSDQSIGCYRIIDPAHNGYNNIVDGTWDFGKGLMSQLLQEYDCLDYGSIEEPFKDWNSYVYLQDGINDPCFEGAVIGECYSWTGGAPWDICRTYKIKVALWAYSASILNPAMDEYNPCNQINLKQDESKKLPNFACGTCISKDIVICKFCKPTTLPGDVIDVQVYPNPIKFGGIINVVMDHQIDQNYITDLQIVDIITGDRILGIENIPYTGPRSLQQIDLEETQNGVYQLVATSSIGTRIVVDFIIN